MLIFSGLIRKCVIADNCAVLANAVFGGQFGLQIFGLCCWGTYAFTWQVYGDFSGYSDIAAEAPIAGLSFHGQFSPALPRHRLQDFWRRWHISLSTWLRDYLFIPLGGSAWPMENLEKSLHYHGPRRFLAWRKLPSSSWRHPWRGVGRRALLFPG